MHSLIIFNTINLPWETKKTVYATILPQYNFKTNICLWPENAAHLSTICATVDGSLQRASLLAIIGPCVYLAWLVTTTSTRRFGWAMVIQLPRQSQISRSLFLQVCFHCSLRLPWRPLLTTSESGFQVGVWETKTSITGLLVVITNEDLELFSNTMIF